MKTRTITFSLSLAALLLAAGETRAQDAATRRALSTDPVEQRAPAANDASADELPAVRRVVEDEATHRDRMARIRRLRELAASDGDKERLTRLDDLERQEQQQNESRRVRSRARLSEQDWNTAENFMQRGGKMRLRMADQQANQQNARERAAAHKSARERNAAASQPSRGGSGSARSASRGGSGSRSGSNSGGASRGPR